MSDHANREAFIGGVVLVRKKLFGLEQREHMPKIPAPETLSETNLTKEHLLGFYLSLLTVWLRF